MRRIRGFSLQTKIGLRVAVGLLVILALFGLVGSSMLHQNVQRMLDERLMVAQLTASFLDMELDEQFEQLSRFARAFALAGDDRLLANERLALLQHTEPFVTSVFFVDRTGSFWSEPGGDSPWDSELIASLVANVRCDSKARYASAIHPVGDPPWPRALLAVCIEGTSSGAVVGAVLDPDHATIRELVAAARQLGNTGHAQLIDQNGLVGAASGLHRPLEPAEHPAFVLPLLAGRTAAAAITEPDEDEETDGQGRRHAMAFAPLRAVPWGISVGGSEEELFLEVERWRWQIGMISGLALAAALLLVWVTTRGVGQSVTALTAASRRIGSGDLATPVPETGDGEVRALAETLDDMRRHLQDALDALAVETSRYQGIVSAMADAVFSTDRHCRVTAYNPTAEALTGWRSEAAIGEACRTILRSIEQSGQELCDTSCKLDLRSAHKASPGVTRQIIRRSDGSPVPVAYARSAIRDSEGAFAGVVHVLRDISNEERVERLKDEFLSMVSHELRTPLGHIKGYATTLLLPDGPVDDDTRQRCLRVIVEASDELAALVDSLLDMSKIGAGAFVIEPQPVRLRPLVRTAVERTASHSGGHKLRMHVSPRLPTIFADPCRIEQVLYNLLDNALKYSPLGGCVFVSAEVVSTEAVVSISDEGIGIPRDELPNLFEPFRRGNGARSKRISGSGLGLAVCKGIIEAHHGRIWVESPVPGRVHGPQAGTVVRFSLPINAAVLHGRKSIAGESSLALPRR